MKPKFNGTTCRMKSWRNLNEVQSSCKMGILQAPESERFGCVDEVIIWNRSLSQDEIRNHYLRGAANLTLQTRTGPYYENSNPRRVLSLHMTPDPTNSSRAEDDSAQGNDGTISGAHFVEGKLGSALRFDGIDDYVKVEVTE